MGLVLITGSADGLGLMTGRLLAQQGHTVVLHARNASRAEDARAALPQAHAVLVGDVSTLAAMKDVAAQADAVGRFDAVIHNVALGYRERRRVETSDGLSQLWAINVLAPYVLTALMRRPDRLVYLSSGMHSGGHADFGDLQWERRGWNGNQAYADTKLQNILLAFGVARHWPTVRSNALTPGWVATRMGGPGASDDLEQAHLTQAWLATGEDGGAERSGGYFYHLRAARVSSTAQDPTLQDRLLDYCRDVSGVALG